VHWIVGDVQGCAEEFEDLLHAIAFRPDDDEIYLAGDLINRGPQSLETLNLWLTTGARGVLGNHDIYALGANSGRWSRRPDTLAALFDADEAPALFTALRSLPVLVHLPPVGGGREAWLVHGGLHPAWTDLPAIAARINDRPHDDDWLTSSDVTFATRVRCCTETGERSPYDREPEGCPAPFRPWDEFYRGDAIVVHGHWASRGHYRNERTMGLDSGCVYGGPLTAWCQETDRIVQVPHRSQRRPT